jgi:hypothetical protein
MAKTTARKTSRKSTKKVTRRVARVNTSLLTTDGKGFWGKDQPMILLLSSGIILLIILGLFFSGWL